MNTMPNYQTLAKAIVFQAIEDAQGEGHDAKQAFQWLMMQGVYEIYLPLYPLDDPGLLAQSTHCPLCDSEANMYVGEYRQ